MPKWWWERWRRGGKRLRRDEPRAHQAMVEAEAELIQSRSGGEKRNAGSRRRSPDVWALGSAG
jgi:hypothetical protein